ncbi:hypothetical protein MRX96_023407 [Rhipicephalus microplus]
MVASACVIEKCRHEGVWPQLACHHRRHGCLCGPFVNAPRATRRRASFSPRSAPARGLLTPPPSWSTTLLPHVSARRAHRQVGDFKCVGAPRISRQRRVQKASRRYSNEASSRISSTGIYYKEGQKKNVGVDSARCLQPAAALCGAMKTVVKWEVPCLERFIAHEARKYTRHGYDGRFPTARREGDAPLFSPLVDSERAGTLRGRESALLRQRASYNPFRALAGRE